LGVLNDKPDLKDLFALDLLNQALREKGLPEVAAP
jgi:hypothetical protein